MRIAAALGGLVLLLTSTHTAWAAPITTESLIAEMVDMQGLTEMPDPHFKTVQFSSYDHRSNLPGGPGWFANADGFGREPAPNFEGVAQEPNAEGIGAYIICDVKGPGAIVRTWTARILGEIEVYLDGASTPLFKGPAQDFLMNPYASFAEAAGIDAELLSGALVQRNAAYCPIPFAQGCKMLWTGHIDWTHFYQVQIRCYEPGAEVETFAPQDLKASKKTLSRVARMLTNPAGEWKYAAKGQPEAIDKTLEPGSTHMALRIEGAKAIERLSLKVEAENLRDALRQTILHVQCDDYPWGQVQAPIGDFFGAAPDINPYDSVPFTVAPDGAMTCRYVMPFAESLEIHLENLGSQPVHVTGEALVMDRPWDDERSMHFRARWRVDHGVKGQGTPAQDMPYLVADGAGLYVGTSLMLLNPNDIPTAGGNWWGEGDEKVFVDDDFCPSTFGTGSEDYFNYAWSSNDIFIYPYCGQPRNDGPANRGFVTNYRWHILDPLPFKDRIAFYMELFSHERTEDFSYARIAYHYGRPGLIDDHILITREDVRPPRLPAKWAPAARGRAKGSTFYEAEDLLQGGANVVQVDDALWSGGSLRRWRPQAIGEELALKLTIPEEGKYDIRLGMALDAQSGALSMTVDGEDARLGGESGVADLFVPHRTMLRNVPARTMPLTQGEHTLTLRFEGGREEGETKSVGIDYIWVQPRK